MRQVVFTNVSVESWVADSYKEEFLYGWGKVVALPSHSVDDFH